MIARRVQGHQTVSLEKSVRANQEIGKETSRSILRSPPSSLSVSCETSAALEPCQFGEFIVDSNTGT